jgi:hypothetical protein
VKFLIKMIPSKFKFFIKRSKINYLRILIQEILFRSRYKDYSQFGEQIYILDFFGSIKGKYLDIGAGQPIKGSNTYALYRKGWTGICVDPLRRNSWLHRLLRKRDEFVQSLAGPPGEASLFSFEPYAYSTILPDVATKVLEKLGEGVHLKRVSKIEVIPPHQIVQRFTDPTKVNFLSIDVEGADLEVLKSNDWSIFSPNLICVEQWEEDLKLEGFSQFLESKGYRFEKRIGYSTFWSKQKNDPESFNALPFIGEELS